MVYPKTREKIQTRIFGLGSGQVSLNKISGFSGLTSENPKNSGRVSSIFGFLDTLHRWYIEPRNREKSLTLI